MTDVTGSGAKGSTGTLMATLTSGGSPLAGEAVRFRLRGRTVGIARTDSAGVATLSGVRLRGIQEITYPGAVAAVFAGDRKHLRSSGRGDLVVGRVAASLSGVSGSGSFGGDGSLTATLRAGGAPLPGQVVHFSLNGRGVGSATTDAQGIATLGGVSLTGESAGDHLSAVTARYEGNAAHQAHAASGSLAVARAQALVSLGGLSQTYDGSMKSAAVTTSAPGLPVQVRYTDSNGNTVTTPTDAGKYLVTATITDPNHQGSASGVLVIARAQLSVVGLAAVARMYDGSTDAELDARGASLAGLAPGDVVTVMADNAKGTFGTKSVGTGKPVAVAGLSLGGADAGNYTLLQPTTSGDVTPALVSVSGFAAGDKVYDGTTDTTGDGSAAEFVGVIPGDDVALDFNNITAHFDTKDVGAGKTVTILGLGITGADAGNYTLTLTTTMAEVTPAALSVTGVRAADKPFDGFTNATLDTSGAALVGVLVDDDVVLVTAGATGEFESLTAGDNKTVFVSGLSLSGSDAGNYTVTQPTTTANITDFLS